MIHMRTITTHSLIEAAYRPEIVEGYCESCPYYESNFSCPTHSFSTVHYLLRYPSLLLIHHKIHHDPLEDILDSFFECREWIDPILMAFERRFRAEALLPGCCYNCSDNCSRIDAQECLQPLLRRYSLESLGIDVDEALRFYFDTPLLFSPESLTFVYGFLLHDPPDPIRLVELESELKKVEY